MSSNHIKGNIIKNAIVLLIALILYPVVSTSIAPIGENQINNFLTIVSILLVTVCFANFAFTYEKSNLQTKGGKALAHVATGIFMLLTAILLESMTLAVHSVYPTFYGVILFFSILTYVGIVLYDFWDLMKAQ